MVCMTYCLCVMSQGIQALMKDFADHRMWLVFTNVSVSRHPIQYNATKAFITLAWSAGGPSLRHGQLLGGKMARHGSKRRHTHTPV